MNLNWFVIFTDFPPDVPKEENILYKNTICRSIAASPFLRDTFHVYPIQPHSSIILNGSLTRIPTNITDQYSRRETIVDGNVFHNFVFPCLLWHQDTQDLMSKFFISCPFRHHLTNIRMVPLRLMFMQDEKTNSLRLL